MKQTFRVFVKDLKIKSAVFTDENGTTILPYKIKIQAESFGDNEIGTWSTSVHLDVPHTESPNFFIGKEFYVSVSDENPVTS